MAYPLFLARFLIRSGLARLLPSVQRQVEGGGAFLHYLSDRVLTCPHDELRVAGSFLELSGPDAIDLALPAPRFDLSPSASTKLPADRRGWPPLRGTYDLRLVIADRLSREHRLAVSPSEEILVTHGVTGAFNAVAEAFLNPGDRVVLFDPASPLFSLAAQARGARLHWIPTWMEEGRTRFRLEHLVNSMRRAKLIVVNSPCNPTGGVIADEDLEQIAWWADRRDVLIFCDDSYARYRYAGPGLCLATLPRLRSRTLLAGGVSKGHALASSRVGWLTGHRHLIRPCLLASCLQSPFVATVCQQQALAALQQPEVSFEPLRAEFDSRRRYTFERLRSMGLAPAWPEGGFFFWISIHGWGMSGSAFAEQLRQTRRVLVTPGHLYGPSGVGHIRLSYAAEDGRLREGLSRLGEFVKTIQASPNVEPQLAA